MEKGSKKKKIEITRGIGLFETTDKKGKKRLGADIGENIKRISIENGDSSEYNPSKNYLKDLKVEIIGTEGHSETLLNFIKNI